MIFRILTSVFGVSKEALLFVFDERKRTIRRLAVVLPLTAWSAILYQISPLFLKWQIDSITGEITSISSLSVQSIWAIFLVITIGYLFLQILDIFLIHFKDIILMRITQQTEAYLEDKFNAFLMKFDGSFLDAENNIRIIRNLQNEFRYIQEDFIKIQQYAIEIPFGVLTFLTILPLLHPSILIVVIVTVVVSLILDNLQSLAWRRYELVETRKSEVRYGLRWKITTYFSALLSNGWITELLKTYKVKRKEYFDSSIAQSITTQRISLASNLFGIASNTATTLIAGFLVTIGAITIGTFTIFGSYISRIQGVLDKISSLIILIIRMRYTLLRVDFLIHISPKLDYSNIQPFEADSIESVTLNSVSFNYPQFYQEEQDYLTLMQQRLGFEQNNPPVTHNGLRLWWWKMAKKITSSNIYQDKKDSIAKEIRELEKMFSEARTNKQVLTNLSASFQKGKIHALVGYNGAGKTTLTKLLKRTLDPTIGNIELIITNNSVEQKSHHQQSVRRPTINKKLSQRNLFSIDPLLIRNYISSTEQNSFVLSSLSVRENLLLGIGKREVTDEELNEAIKKVGLEEVITSLDLTIGEGIELSGGQEQLLELARVYIQKKPIVILDEGTNQLDAIKEQQILNILQEIKQQSIVIFVTHRMTTCSKCDTIMVLDNGQLMDQGTHQELLESHKDNLYKTFWNIQVLGNSSGNSSV